MEDKIKTIREWLGEGSINIFGMPFAGKDTQGNALCDLLGGTLLGGGDILRNSVIPDHVREIMHRGDLVPSDDYRDIVLPYLSRDEFKGAPLFLSSVGRWDGEQHGVIDATNSAGHVIKAVISLIITEDTARTRHAMSITQKDRGSRADDDEKVFSTRIEEYKTKTSPVIEHYRKMGLLIEIPGSIHAAEVTEQIINELYALARQVESTSA